MLCEPFGPRIEVANVFGYTAIRGCTFKGGGFYVRVKKILGISLGHALSKFSLQNTWF